MTASGPDVETSSLEYPILRKPFGIDELLRIVTVYSPRLWDDDEPCTEEDAVISREQGTLDTSRDNCALCESRAASRCPRCGGALCKRCLPPSPDARCPGCVPP
jgi:hypothetical protein